MDCDIAVFMEEGGNTIMNKDEKEQKKQESWHLLEYGYIKQIESLQIRLKCAQEWIRVYCCGQSMRDKCKQKKIENIVIYGVSNFALLLIEACFKEDIHIVGISDSKITTGGMDYLGIPFISPQMINNLGNNVTIVITAMGFVEEIKHELIGRGINNIISLLELIE